ncbi:MAG: carbon-nitrogen hydrolase family protein [Geminicoccaceae bacterium]
MRIAAFQGPLYGGDVAQNLERLDGAAAEAAAGGARLLICPEMFLTGYAIGPEAVARLAEPVAGPSAARACEIAAARGLALLYGYAERDEDGRIYNAALLVDRDRRHLANHRKTHLFGALDRDAFSAGEGPPTLAELDGLRLGILICYDVEFPENVRLLAAQGADFVAVPTALMEPYDFVARSLVRTRAYENQVFLAYVNRCGSEGDLRYHGLSCIVGPDGVDLARAGTGEEMLLADLDPALLAASRPLNTYLADRRPELYQGLVKPEKPA